MAAGNIPRHVVLTGPPGVGKTTLIHKACEAIQNAGFKVQGFYTEEVRERGRRIGFDVVTLDGKRGQLARIGADDPNTSRQCRVGQYVVQIASFEKTALPVLKSQEDTQPVYVIDEVGKMEMFSQNFVQTVKDLLAKPTNTVLATIPIRKGKPILLVEEIRNNKEATVFEISRVNRDVILDDVVKAVVASYKHYASRGTS